MWAIEVRHKITGEENTIMGYNPTDAFRRKGWNPDDYEVVDAIYED